MPLQATSGAASYDAFGGGAAAVPNYIEDVFSTWLYTGNGSTQTITNGIDLAGKGGLVWTGRRTTVNRNTIYDTTRTLGGFPAELRTYLTDAQAASGSISSFNSNGYSLTADIDNTSGASFASWTFREQPKFFDVVTWTGNSTGGRQISHNLGSTPGCIIIKRTDATSDWAVYHRGLTSPAAERWIKLNTTAAETGADSPWSDTAPTSTNFTVNASDPVNASGGTYVAYLFAHNAGGFGLTGTDNVISCGSFTSSSIGLATVDLGYEPQWILYKGSNGVTNWQLVDNMRGFVVGAANSGTSFLNANTSAAEGTNPPVGITNTGFNFDGAANITYIYIAIRRGPMKVPTSGTKVFAVGTRSGSGSVAKTNSDILTDLTFIKNRTSGGEYWAWTPRLAGNLTLQSNSTDAELTGAMATNPWDTMTGAFCAAGNGATNSGSLIDYSVRRAPGFFDVVCYTGNDASPRAINHNLGGVPDLLIVKTRSATGDWSVSSPLTNQPYIDELLLNSSDAVAMGVGNIQGATSTTFTTYLNTSGVTYVAYLFSTCPGVSKVGKYTGTGTTQTINCGFTGGARFVLIKRINGTGDWYVWDSARGIVSGNDPYLLLNSTAAEVTNTDYIDTASTGFEISSTAPAAINASGGTFIFLAIA